jgi:hypothetical protein
MRRAEFESSHIRLLDELSRGAPGSRLTIEARVALGRLEDRRKAASH